jgi:hypothetical protein
MTPSNVKCSRAALVRHRWRAQGLAAPLGDKPEAVVGRLAAVQAERYSLAKWSLGQRTTGATDATIERALTEGAILRTHLLRPTWHFVLARDFRWIQRLTAPRVRSMTASRRRELELDPEVLSRSRKIITRALRGGRHHTRRELAARLGAGGIETNVERLAHLMMDAELECLVCSGIPEGKWQTYALLDERAPSGVPLAGEEALAELARRYFTTRGPATEVDFRWWSSLRATDARWAIEAIASSLERVELDGRTYWMSSDDELPACGRPPSIQLIHRLDEYVVAYTRSRDLILGKGLDRVTLLGQRDEHPVLRLGHFAGRWQARASGIAAELVDPGDRDGLDRAVARYQRFFRQEA